MGKAALIHSVDSQRLLQAIDSQAGKLGLVQDILLEVNIAGEESKGAAPRRRRRSWPPWRRGWTMCACGADGHPSGFSGAWGQPPVLRRSRQLFVDIKGKWPIIKTIWIACPWA